MVTEVASLIFKAETADLVNADATLAQLERTGKRTEQGEKSLTAQISKMNAEMARQEAIVGMTEDQIQLYDAALQGATQEELDAIKAIQQRTQALKIAQAQQVAANDAVGASVGHFQAQKGAVTQAAFQIQDFAVQVGAGQSAFTAFAQQAPQFLSIFGVGGAIIGGIVAVTAAIGGPFVARLFESKSAVEQLENSVSQLSRVLEENEDGVLGLSEEYKKLAAAGSLAAQARLKEGILDAEDALKAARVAAAELAGELSASDLGGRFNLDNTRFTILENKLRDGKIGVEDFAAEIDKLFIGVKGPTEGFREFRDSLGGVVEKAEQARKSLELLRGKGPAEGPPEEVARIIERLQMQSQAAEQGADSINVLRAAQAGASAADIERIRTLEQLIEKQNKLASDAEYAADAYAEYRANLTQGFTSIENASRTANLSPEDLVRAKYEEQKRILELAAEEFPLLEQRKQAALDALELARDTKLDELRAARLEKDKQAAQARIQFELQSQQQMLSAQVGFGQQMAALIGQNAEEGSAAAKAAYAITQGIQVVQAINNANLAYTSTLAQMPPIPDPTGAMYAATLARAEIARNIGYATAAVIAGNAVGTLAGRAQGGQVRPGEKYRVGEFGPETLIMGSNGGAIVPNKAANDPVKLDVQTNVQIVGGNPDAQVTTTARQVSDRQVIIDVMVDQLGNPSSRPRQALQGSSNVQSRGTR